MASDKPKEWFSLRFELGGCTRPAVVETRQDLMSARAGDEESQIGYALYHALHGAQQLADANIIVPWVLAYAASWMDPDDLDTEDNPEEIAFLRAAKAFVADRVRRFNEQLELNRKNREGGV